MKILCLIPPYVPSYFNAGHHLALFSVAAYLRRQPGVAAVKAVDACAEHYNWKDIADLLQTPYNLVILLNDFDAIDTFERMQYYIQSFLPQAKTATFGRLSQSIAPYFQKFNFDAIHYSGDPEWAMGDYVRHLIYGEEPAQGLDLKDSQGRYRRLPPGGYMPAEDWVLPDVDDIPHRMHNRYYQNDLNKFCGIPERVELVVPIARGCPVNCAFCDVPAMQGLKERRLSVGRTLAYIEESFAHKSLEYISFYAPTFTLKRQWVRNLCTAMIEKGSPWPWKCVTTIGHLDEEIIRIMAAAGCVRISVGLESLDQGTVISLPKIKHPDQDRFSRISALCTAQGIELNCFIILGLPGDSFEGVKKTIDLARAYGARVRPTIYTPYHTLHPDMSSHDISRFNRQIFVQRDPVKQTATDPRYYQLFYDSENDKATTVMTKIARLNPPALKDEAC